MIPIYRFKRPGHGVLTNEGARARYDEIIGVQAAVTPWHGLRVVLALALTLSYVASAFP